MVIIQNLKGGNCMNKVKKRILIVLSAILGIVVLAAVAFLGLYFTRIQTFSSIEQLTDYADGYNLYRRMEKFKEAHLRFLYDYTIPTTNNAAERYLRNYKRKQKQAISFRSFTSIEDLCNGKR